MATIPEDTNWVDDVCNMNLVQVAYSSNKVYVVGGASFLRPADPGVVGGGVGLSNSHLYTLDFTRPISNISNEYHTVFTNVTRLPDSLIPRTSWGNVFVYNSSLNLFGGAQTTFPIYLSNGSLSREARVEISDGVWQYDLARAEWMKAVKVSGMGARTPIGQAAKAYDESRGVGWMYGGSSWVQEYTVGSESVKSNSTDPSDFYDLWKVPGDELGSTTNREQFAYREEMVIAETAKSVAKPNSQGAMVFIDNGGDGLLVLFGGSISGKTVSMSTVHIYDIGTKTWYLQPTTASPQLENSGLPLNRTGACAVVATAPDKSSYNIYMHGGVSGDADPKSILGGLWILTLPTFHWIRSGTGRENPRAGHGCAKVNDKYMVVYRGVPNFGGTPCDANAGIQVLDLEMLEWTRKVDVGAGYKVPEKIYEVIGGSAGGGATFTSPKDGFLDENLYQLFNVTRDRPYTPPSNRTTTTSSPSPTDQMDQPTEHKQSNHLTAAGKAGAIAGGIVTIAIIFILLWFLRRRRQQALLALAQAPLEMATRSQDSLQELHGLEMQVPPAELAAKEPPAMELGEQAKEEDVQRLD